MSKTKDEWSIWEWTIPEASRIRCLAATQFAALDASDPEVPYIVTDVKMLTDIVDKDETLQKGLARLKDDARRSIEKKNMLQRSAAEDMSLPESVRHAFVKTLPDRLVLLSPTEVGEEPGSHAVRRALEIDYWARLPHGSTNSMEAVVLPSMRYSCEGTRTVICAPFTGLGSYVRQFPGQRAWKQPISSVATSGWLEAATPTALDEAVSAGVVIYSGSIGPGEMLWMPTGFLRCERTRPELSVGLCFSLLYSQDSKFGEVATAIKADLLNMNKINAAISLAHDLKVRPEGVAPATETPKAGEWPTRAATAAAAPAAAEAAQQQGRIEDRADNDESKSDDKEEEEEEEEEEGRQHQEADAAKQREKVETAGKEKQGKAAPAAATAVQGQQEESPAATGGDAVAGKKAGR